MATCQTLRLPYGLRTSAAVDMATAVHQVPYPTLHIAWQVPAPCYNAGTMSAFEEVEHTADLALRVRGRDLGELLANAALGLSSLLCPASTQTSDEVPYVSARGVLETSEVCPPADQQTRQVEVEALDAESLIVEWLSELAYWAERDRFVCTDIEVQSVAGTHLHAACRGSRRTGLHRHIKAVTYHNLAIVQTARGLEVTIVFDV
jgi:SHS2 domain-containing protein